MYININDPDNEGAKGRNAPQVISSLVLGVSISLIIFTLLFLLTVFLGIDNASGSESIITMITLFWIPAAILTFFLAILVGLLLAKIIYKKRIDLVNKDTPAAHNREISLYVLSGFLLLVVCCITAAALLVISG